MNIKWNYKIIYKTKYKILIYRDTRQPVSTSKMQQKTPRRAISQPKIQQVDDLHFNLKTHSHRRPPHTPLVKTKQPISQQMEHWNWLKYVNIFLTRKHNLDIAYNGSLLASIF